MEVSPRAGLVLYGETGHRRAECCDADKIKRRIISMRREDRRAEPVGIIEQCKVCRIAMIAEGEPYIVPLNFGFEQKGERVSLYFHSAPEGRKISAMQGGVRVCFELDCEHKLFGEGDSAEACSYSFEYASVIGYGTVHFIETLDEKKRALGHIMKHQTGRDEFTFGDRAVENICVFKLRVESMDGKRCRKS